MDTPGLPALDSIRAPKLTQVPREPTEAVHHRDSRPIEPPDVIFARSLAKYSALETPRNDELKTFRASALSITRHEHDWKTAYGIGGALYAQASRESHQQTLVRRLAELESGVKSRRQAMTSQSIPYKKEALASYDRELSHIQSLKQSAQAVLHHQEQAQAQKVVKTEQTRAEVKTLISKDSDRSIIAQKISELNPGEQAEWLLEYSIAKHRLSSSMLGRFFDRITGQRPAIELNLGTMIGDLGHFVTEHPILSA